MQIVHVGVCVCMLSTSNLPSKNSIEGKVPQICAYAEYSALLDDESVCLGFVSFDERAHLLKQAKKKSTAQNETFAAFANENDFCTVRRN